jgi:hypothetical protein
MTERAMAAAAMLDDPVALRVLPFRPTLANCDAWPRSPGAHAGADALGRRVDRWMARGRALWRPTCLTRTLVLYTLLRQHGHTPRLHIGTAGAAHRFRAHAWVSLGGSAVAEPEPPLGDYRELLVHGA